MIGGFALGLNAPSVPLEQRGLPAPQHSFALALLQIGAVLQFSPAFVAVLARRRWRSAVLLAVIGLLLSVWTWSYPGPKLAAFTISTTVVGLGCVGLAFWLLKFGRGADARPSLSLNEANLLVAMAVILFLVAELATLTIDWRQCCPYVPNQ
jgi:hypothetical protein